MHLPPSVCTQVQSNSSLRTLIITVIAGTCESTEGGCKIHVIFKKEALSNATHSLGCSFVYSLCHKLLIWPPTSPPQEEKSEIKTAIRFHPKTYF